MVNIYKGKWNSKLFHSYSILFYFSIIECFQILKDKPLCRRSLNQLLQVWVYLISVLSADGVVIAVAPPGQLSETHVSFAVAPGGGWCCWLSGEWLGPSLEPTSHCHAIGATHLPGSAGRRAGQCHSETASAISPSLGFIKQRRLGDGGTICKTFHSTGTHHAENIWTHYLANGVLFLSSLTSNAIILGQLPNLLYFVKRHCS